MTLRSIRLFMGVTVISGILSACSDGGMEVDPPFVAHYRISTVAGANTYYLSPIRVSETSYNLGIDATNVAPRFDDDKAWRVTPTFNTPGLEDVFNVSSLDWVMGQPNILTVLNDGVFSSVEFSEYPPDPELSVWRVERQPSGLCQISNLQLGNELVLSASSASTTAQFTIAPFNNSDVQEWRFEKVGDLTTDLDQRCNGIPSQ